jgi:LuxR family transcriptional regulator, maltose regulon positive regulatory protein
MLQTLVRLGEADRAEAWIAGLGGTERGEMCCAHAALIAEILDVIAGKEREPARSEPVRLREPLSESETRVLRYLPTNLSVPEVASELSLSVNTIRTHIRHVYEKLGAHCRTEAVEQARAVGLLAPSSRRR